MRGRVIKMFKYGDLLRLEIAITKRVDEFEEDARHANNRSLNAALPLAIGLEEHRKLLHKIRNEVVRAAKQNDPLNRGAS